jgi:hypothetical protein
MEKQPVELIISDEGKEYYRNSVQQGEQESYDAVVQRREQLKNEKIGYMDYSYVFSNKVAQINKDAGNTTVDKANGYVEAYAELYDEIMQGYENGTREIYVADEEGTHKLTKDEELSALDSAYKKTVDSFVTRENTAKHALEIIAKDMEKISKISSKPTMAADYLEKQKARGKNKIPENLNEKMYQAVVLFREKYTMFDRNAESLSQLLDGIKIS